MFCHSKWNSRLIHFINDTCIERQFYGRMAARVSGSKFLLIHPTGVRRALLLSNIIILQVFWVCHTMMSISSVKHYVVTRASGKTGNRVDFTAIHCRFIFYFVVFFHPSKQTYKSSQCVWLRPQHPVCSSASFSGTRQIES